MFLTRMGTDARIVVTGDTTQVDLEPGTPDGLSDAVRRLEGIDGIGVVRLDRSDIVRHPLVQKIVNAYERTGSPIEPGMMASPSPLDGANPPDDSPRTEPGLAPEHP
jgi:phosphate starvation-inducible PhoH-like protein